MEKADERWRRKLHAVTSAMGSAGDAVYAELVADIEEWADERVQSAGYAAAEAAHWQAVDPS